MHCRFIKICFFGNKFVNQIQDPKVCPLEDPILYRQNQIPFRFIVINGKALVAENALWTINGEYENTRFSYAREYGWRHPTTFCSAASALPSSPATTRPGPRCECCVRRAAVSCWPPLAPFTARVEQPNSRGAVGGSQLLASCPSGNLEPAVCRVTSVITALSLYDGCDGRLRRLCASCAPPGWLAATPG